MKKPWKWVIGGAALIVVSPVVYQAVSWELQIRALKEAAATATRFLGDLNAHDYAGAHLLLGAPQQRSITVAALRAAEEQIEGKHGKALGRVETDEYNVDQGGTRARFFCDNAYAKESEPIHVVLMRTDAGWRVSEYRYDFSPV